MVFDTLIDTTQKSDMATINFYLKKANKKGESPIMLTYQHRGKKFRYYTRLRVNALGWKDQRVKPHYEGALEINSILDDIENSLKAIQREAIFNKKDYSIDVIRRKFFLKLGELTHENDFFKIYDRFIEDSRAVKTKGTIQTYAATKKKLMNFAAAKNYKIGFESIDQNFYEVFMNYLIAEKHHLNNTVGKHIKTLKVFLNYAVDHEYTAMTYNLKKFKVLGEEADIIYLTEEELMKIYRLPDLPQRLIDVRDNFCFACFTGLRFSDIDKLQNHHIHDGFVEIRTEKTKDRLKIPLNVFAMEILNKYSSYYRNKPLPTGISNQKSNDYLKEIAELADIKEMVSMEKFSGSNKVVVNKPKCELISTHTARRTFVTLALEKGVRAETVMAMTGHRSYKTFKRYIKITDKVMQAEMNRAWKPILRAV